MKQIVWVVGMLFLLVFAFNTDCRSEESAGNVAEQAVAGADVDAKAPCKGDKQEAKGAADAGQEKADQAAEGAKEKAD